MLTLNFPVAVAFFLAWWWTWDDPLPLFQKANLEPTRRELTMRGFRWLAPAFIGLSACASAAGAETQAARAPSADPVAPVVRVATADSVDVCVPKSGRAWRVRAEYDPDSRITRIGGVPTTSAYPPLPPPYADTTAWFARYEPVVFRGRRLRLNGPVRPVSPGMVPIGEFRGVRLYVYAREKDERDPGIVLVPVSQGCELQTYYYFDESGPIR